MAFLIQEENYNKDMYFVHIEVYDMESANNEGEFTEISQVIKPWNLPREPWIFLINNKGIITNKILVRKTIETALKQQTQTADFENNE